MEGRIALTEVSDDAVTDVVIFQRLDFDNKNVTIIVSASIEFGVQFRIPKMFFPQKDTADIAHFDSIAMNPTLDNVKYYYREPRLWSRVCRGRHSPAHRS